MGLKALTYNNELFWKTQMTLSPTGDGTGVSTLRMQASADTTLTITGSANFYTDAAGTLGESKTWTITAGALRTIYIRQSLGGDSTIAFPDRRLITKFGSSSAYGWESSTNAASLAFTPADFVYLTQFSTTGTSVFSGALPAGLTYIALSGNSISWTYSGALPVGLTILSFSGSLINWTYSGALPTGLTYLYFNSNLINWTYSGALPTGLTYLYFNGNSISWTYSGALPAGLTILYFNSNLINWTYSGALPTGLTYLYFNGNSISWTGLDVGNTGNIGTFSLLNYRIAKMTSTDMVTLLTQMTNRTGTLPATVTINDYADYASPPATVTDAVALLKSTKSITTVNLGA